MRMTPAVLVLGGLLIFAPVLFMFVILPWLTMSEQGFGYLQAAHRTRGRRAFGLCEQWLHLLPYAVHSQLRLGHRLRKDSAGRRLRRRLAPPLRDRAHRSGPFSGRRRASQRLAPGALRQPEVHPARVTYAFLGVSRPGKNQGPYGLRAEPWI